MKISRYSLVTTLLLLLVVGLLTNILFMKTVHRKRILKTTNIELSGYLNTTPASNDITTTNYLEKKYNNESAFVVKGYAGLKLMEKQSMLRPLFNFSLTPWKVHIHQNDTKEEEGNTKWIVFIMIKSLTANFDRRNNSRNGWASAKYVDNIRMEKIFIVGLGKTVQEENKLVRENEEYGDLLQIDIEDVYSNVGHKTLAGMQWVSNNLPPHWLYTSADDDVVPELKEFIKKMEEMMTDELEKRNINCSATNSCIKSAFDHEILSNLPIQCGYRFSPDSTPVRSKHYKNQVDEIIYPFDLFPPCCYGGWYTMPVKLASAIYRVSRQHSFFYLDDVWITGLLRLRYFSDSDVQCMNCDVTDESVKLRTRNYGYAKHH